MNGLRKQSSGHVWHQFSVFTGSHWLRAVTIENSLMSRYDFSYKSAGNGCRAVESSFEPQNPRELGIWYIKV